MKKLSSRQIWIGAGAILIILLYLSTMFLQYLHCDFNQMFGYLDPQLYWQGLSDLASRKVIYRDFFWEYGILYLIIGLPLFLLLGKTFFASVLLRFFILPTISVFLSFLLGKQLLKKGFLFLFLFLLLLYGVNNDFTSLRHILPELGLVTLLLGKITLGSFLIALSLTSSIEYGIAAFISAGCYFFIIFFKNSYRIVLVKILRFLAIQVLIAGPYFLFLWKTNALKNFITFSFEYAQSFYYNSPCREVFPRLNDATLSLKFIQSLNLYFVPLILVVLLGWAMTKRKSHWFSIVNPLLVYSLLIFYRTLTTPCVGYLSYGLTFLFLILILILSLPKESFQVKVIVWLAIFWFLILGFLNNINFLIKQGPMKLLNNAEYLPIAGIRLNKELVREYQQITELIKENSQGADYIYIYPNGPYNHLAGRKSPVSIASSWYYDLVPSLVNLSAQQLKQQNPKLVVINTYNAWSLRSALNNIPYNVHAENNGIIFEGITTPVEEFIAQNYEIVKKFELAWVLSKRDEPKPTKELYLPHAEAAEWEIFTQGLSQNQYLTLGEGIEFKVDKNNPLIQFHSKALNEANLIKIPIKVDLGIGKMFSKFIVNVYGRTTEGKLYLLTQQSATSDWQTIWVYPSKTSKLIKLNSIMISISDNKGFFWWGKPKSIDVKDPETFVRNPNLKIIDSAF